MGLYHSIRCEMPCPLLNTTGLRILGITPFPNYEVAHEYKRGGGVVVGHGMARAQDVVVGEAALGTREEVSPETFFGSCRRVER